MQETGNQNSTEENNFSDTHYQVYLDERKALVEAIRDTSQQFDKAILTLSAGALAISITFLEKIAPHPLHDSLRFLYASWIGFIVSMLSTLVSFITSQKACTRQISILEYDYLKEGNKQENPFRIWTDALNILSIASFIISVIFLVSFSITNLKIKGDTKMSTGQSSSLQAGTQKPTPNTGYPPPSPPAKPPTTTPPPTKK